MRLRPALSAVTLLGVSALLSGCVAALVPLAAAGAIGKTQVIDERIGGDFEDIERFVGVSGDGAVEAAGFGSKILAPRSDLSQPNFTECTGLPRAILVDIDGVPGSELDPKLARKRHARLSAAASNVMAEPIYTSERPAADARKLERALSKATGRKITAGENLIMGGGEFALQRRDLRRWEIAQRFCIIAQVGDRKEDFTDSYAFLSQPGAPSTDALDAIIGKGWFLIPGLDPI